MATRYYPALKHPGVEIHSPCRGAWSALSITDRSWNPAFPTFQLMQTKVNAGTKKALDRIVTNQQDDFDFIAYRWITPPLASQTISGTFDLCFQVGFCEWRTALDITNDSVARLKVHVYLSDQRTLSVKQTLVNNYVNPTDLNYSHIYWTQLAVAQDIGTVVIADGDVIVIELGIRLVSSPTPTPTYPPTDNTWMYFGYIGANSGTGDGVDTGSNQDVTLNSWFEFSDDITEKALPAAPANETCETAINIVSAPYNSPQIDNTGAVTVNRALWWKYTAERNGTVYLWSHGSNCGIDFNVWTGTCDALNTVASTKASDNFGLGRSYSYFAFTASAGTTYLIRLQTLTATYSAPLSGGCVRLSLSYDDVATEDDLFIPMGSLIQLRDGAYVKLTNDYYTEAPTGIAIDYTERPMTLFFGGTNTNKRILMGSHQFNLIEIFDVDNFDFVDSIGDPFGATPKIHPAQLYCDRLGMLYAAFFGNGYQYVCGVVSLGGTPPAVLNNISDTAARSAVRIIDATHGDLQAGAPYTATSKTPTIEHTAPWAITLDEATGILYYTSSGFYIPIGGTNDTLRRYNVLTDNQLANLISVTLQGTNNPGIKGLCLIPGGGLLLCNGTVVHRINSTGTIVKTYTPSIPLDSQSLCDVRLTADGTAFWVVDEATTRLFKFNLSSGVELMTVQPYGVPGTLVQMVIFQPSPPPPVPASGGIYQLVPGKTHDTLYAPVIPPETGPVAFDAPTTTTVDVKIPDPFIRTAPLGE